MGRWGDNHNRALKAVFLSDGIDSKRQDNVYIDEVWDSLAPNNYLKQNTLKDRFRTHWKEKSQLYVAENALSGTRRKDLIEEEEGGGGEEDDDDNEEEAAEETVYKEEFKPTPTKMSKKPAATRAVVSTGITYGEDEKPWMPVHSMHQYQYLFHDRVAITIDLLFNFSGKKGTYKLFIEKKGTQLVLKVPIEDIHLDPHHVHSLLATEFGRTFSADSVKELNWNKVRKLEFEDSKGNTKVATFRLNLPFPCEKDFATDLPHPGVVYRFFTKVDGSKFPILYLETKSIHKLVADTNEELDLVAKDFVSPAKSLASKKTPTGHAAALLEALFAQGMSLENVKRTLQSASGKNDDDMDIDGAFDSWKKRKSST